MNKFALLTFPKAGSQWVRDVLFDPRILALRPGLFLHKPPKPEDIKPWPALPDGACAGPFYGVHTARWEEFSAPADRAVLVWRDPRDILISWVFSVSYSHNPHNFAVLSFREPLNHLSLRHRCQIGLNGQVGMGAARMWAKYTGENAMRTKFETLIAEPHETFAEMFDFFGWNVPPALLREVIESHTFEKRSGGRNPGQLDERNHYRRGVAGDWRNYFDRALGELFETVHAGGLVELGYETDNRWFEALPETNERLAEHDRAYSGDTRLLIDELDRLRRRNGALEAGYAAQRALLDEYERLLQPAAASDR